MLSVLRFHSSLSLKKSITLTSTPTKLILPKNWLTCYASINFSISWFNCPQKCMYAILHRLWNTKKQYLFMWCKKHSLCYRLSLHTSLLNSAKFFSKSKSWFKHWSIGVPNACSSLSLRLCLWDSFFWFGFELTSTEENQLGKLVKWLLGNFLLKDLRHKIEH